MFHLVKKPLIDHDGGNAELELYVIRRRGTDGVNHAFGLTASYENGVLHCLCVFTTPTGAMKYLDFAGLGQVQWELVSSKEFGGAATMLKKAPTFATHVAADPPPEHIMAPPPIVPIEDVIDYLESLPPIPFWVLRGEAGEVFGIVPMSGVMAVCLFKTEVDAEEFRHSTWIPTEMPADRWMPGGPANPADAVKALDDLIHKGIRYAAINPPPSGSSSLKVVLIEELINYVAQKEHIRDLD